MLDELNIPVLGAAIVPIKDKKLKQIPLHFTASCKFYSVHHSECHNDLQPRLSSREMLACNSHSECNWKWVSDDVKASKRNFKEKKISLKG